MDFYLIYEGPLGPNGSREEKHKIREALQPQLEALWKEEPLAHGKWAFEPSHKYYVVEKRGKFEFVPVITAKLRLLCELEILFLRPGPLGGAIGAGDIDNRLKTLLDALRVPATSEIPPNQGRRSSAVRFFCLLQDDSLVTSVAVKCHRLLRNAGSKAVHVTIHVKVTASERIIKNLGIAD